MSESIEVGGKQVKVHVIRGSAQPNEILTAMVATGRIVADPEDFLTGDNELVGKASAQLESNDQFSIITGGGSCESPPVRPSYYTTIYRSAPMHRACVDTKVADIVGLGYRIRPRAELFPRAMDLTEQAKAPNMKEQQSIDSFLDLCMQGGTMESFVDVLIQAELDSQVAGQGYVEFSRSTNGAINGIYSIKGESVRIAKGGPKRGFWQTRGGKWGYFAPYTGEKGVKIAEITSGSVEVKGKSHAVPTEWSFKAVDDPRGRGLGDFSFKAGNAEQQRVNELLMFKKPTPKDTHYGEPDIISAIEDYGISQGTRQFVLGYFQNGAVPRLILYVEGDTELSQEVINRIKEYLDNSGAPDGSNKTLLIQIPEDCKFGKEILTDAHLTDSSSMLDLRDRADLYVAMAHRVPLSAIPAIVGSANLNRATSTEANRRYVGSVVRPRQRYIEDRWNYVFRSELGITEWVLDLDIPDLLDMKTKHEIWEIGLRQGFYTINEVRAQLNLPPVKGGDEIVLRVQGQGLIPVSEVEAITRGAKPNDIMASGNTKTPPKNSQGVPAVEPPNGLKALYDGNGKAIAAWVIPTSEVPDMPADECQMVFKALEEVAVNPDDVRKLAGDETDS